MRKIILPLVLFVFTLFSPSEAFAQSSTDCWPTHMIRQYAKCDPSHSKCLKECSYLDTTPKRKVCFEECGRVTKLCTNQAVADYRACVNANRKELDAQEVKQLQTESSPQASPTLVSSPSPFSEENPEVSSPEEAEQPAKSAKEISDWIKDVFGDTPFSDITIEPSPIVPVRPPEITDQKLEDLKLPPITIPSLWNLLPESGYKPEPVSSGSTISSDDEPILVSPGKGGEIMHVAPDTKVTLPSDPAKSNPTIHQGTVEFKTDKPMEVNTDIVDIIVIGTHFWVTHEPGKQTLVGVYTGQVEVKTKDGKTQIVSSDGDKPAVVVVSQKLSLVKLGITGAVLLGIIGGVVFLIKKKFTSKAVSKKKR